ncbi:hypothetical protein VTK73DRAFT_3395 [Phialemonium thermophilum]|uniref:Uncharacterized protein n=1 Tax=Phialemonium thermophilum TaxID=223376 RepID=A0ABR3VIN3_9PEZI
MLDCYEAQQAAAEEARLRRGDAEEGLDRESSWVKRSGRVGPRPGGENATVGRGRSGCQGASGARAAGAELRPRDRALLLAAGQRAGANAARYLGMCWRAHWIGREPAFERWAMRFTDKQWGLLCDVAYELEAVDSRDDWRSSRARALAWDEGGEGTRAGSGSEDEDNQSTAALDQAVFRFLVASIRQRVGSNMYTSPLLCFCAALGIQQHLWAQLVFLEAFFEDTPQKLDEVDVDRMLAFQKKHAAWMGHCNRTGGQASVRWSDNEETLFHHSKSVAVADFRRTLRRLGSEAEGLLDQLLGGAWAQVRQALDIGRIADSIVRLGAGQSFATYAPNRWLEPGPCKVPRGGHGASALLQRAAGARAGADNAAALQLVAAAAQRMLQQEGGLLALRGDALEFLWRDGASKVWDTDWLSRVLGRVMQAGTGVRIGVGRYWCIAIEMGRRIRGLAMRQLDVEIGDEDDESDRIDVDPAMGEPVDCGGSWNIVWDL